MDKKNHHLDNYSLLKSIIFKLKCFDYDEGSYLIVLYAFLYKYSSDILKDHFLSVIENEELTLDEAYRDDGYQMIFKDDAFHMFGYYFDKSDAFIDEIINDKYSDELFIWEFVESFSKNISFFGGGNYKKYFSFMYDVINDYFNFKSFDFNSEKAMYLKDIILTISKLNVFDDDLYIADVFNEVSNLILRRYNKTPNYINQLLSALAFSDKNHAQNIYIPYLEDASLIFEISNHCNFINFYGKEPNILLYCCAIVKLFLGFYDLDYVFIDNSNVRDSVDSGVKYYDFIISKISDNYKMRSNNTQKLELSKRNTRDELEAILSSNFNIDEDSFTEDAVLSNALENLVDKMNFDNDDNFQFSKEYESLKDNEYLFLINLINSLKNDGVMAISISQSFLSRNYLNLLRKYLICEINAVDAVISIQNSMGKYPNPEVIVIFKRDRTDENILFVEMSEKFSTNLSSVRMSGRNFSLDNSSIDKLLDVYKNKKVIEKFSNLVSIDEIKRNEYSLVISRYVDTFEGEFIKLNDLRNEKKKLESNLKLLDDKINDMMDDLDL